MPRYRKTIHFFGPNGFFGNRFATLVLLVTVTLVTSNSFGQIAQRVALQYTAVAKERYALSLAEARKLQAAVNDFLDNPGPETHDAAKEAWVTAHNIYSETEVFRFGNPNVDAWEGKVNAWPLDEGYIDYVANNYIYHVGNPHARHNIIGNPVFPIRDDIIEEYQSGTDPKAAPSQQMTDIETNVATGFHAIEFLIWGQDLNTENPVGGNRPYTDYLLGSDCTNGNCDRRRNYLSAAARLLIQDLQYMVWDWSKEGRYYKEFVKLPVEVQLSRILEGMGSLSYAELAGERMRVALLAYDQEEEQNCFSDTTHFSIYYNAFGIEKLYTGEQIQVDGKLMRGVSLGFLVRRYDPELDKRLRAEFAETRSAAQKLIDLAEKGTPFDQMILPEREEERELINKLIASLRAQTVTLETLLGDVKSLSAI